MEGNDSWMMVSTKDATPAVLDECRTEPRMTPRRMAGALAGAWAWAAECQIRSLGVMEIEAECHAKSDVEEDGECLEVVAQVQFYILVNAPGIGITDRCMLNAQCSC